MTQPLSRHTPQSLRNTVLGFLDMKYVIVTIGVRGKEIQDKMAFITVPIIFPRPLAHNLMMEGVRASCYLANEPLTNPEVISAGFFRIKEGVVEVYGRSESLRIDSRPEDAVIIHAFLS